MPEEWSSGLTWQDRCCRFGLGISLEKYALYRQKYIFVVNIA